VGAYVLHQAILRKVKTSFGGPRDRAISSIHDVAFRPRVREITGRGEVLARSDDRGGFGERS